MSRPSPSLVPAAKPPLKWLVMAGYWIVQAIVVYLLCAAWIVFNAQSGGSGRPLYGFSLSGFFELLTDPYWALRTLGGIGIFTLLQGLFLLPVAKPSVSLEGRGTALWLSAAAAAVAVALMWGAAAAAVVGVIQLVDVVDWTGDLAEPVVWGALASVFIAWAVATPLIIAFVSRGRRETALGRLSAAIFLGTAVEAVAIVPIDVMMRRKTDCYCDTGTFWALSACGTVGLFVLGPAIALPLIASRRKRWYQSRCDACGYDMSATMTAPRCPECGAGWRSGSK